MGAGSELIDVIKKYGYHSDQDCGAGLASVISVSPIRIKLAADQFELDSDDFYITNRLTRKYLYVNDAGETVTDEGLAVGDTVIVLSFNSGQNYCVIDKLIRGDAM